MYKILLSLLFVVNLTATTYRYLGIPPNQVMTLPSRDVFTFTMYGAPSDLSGMQAICNVMMSDQLGNGIDPGPIPLGVTATYNYLGTLGWPVSAYPGGGMQVASTSNATCSTILGTPSAAVFAARDQENLFTVVQLGEWDYYFHENSTNAAYFQSVCGTTTGHSPCLSCPQGCASASDSGCCGYYGYSAQPADRATCYNEIKSYVTGRNTDLLGRILSTTGHSQYEAYAGEFGARVIGLEIGETVGYTQSKIDFARGAAIVSQVPWSAQVSPWFSNSHTTTGPLREICNDGGGPCDETCLSACTWVGQEAGHSLSLYVRMWLYTWFSGAAMVTPEDSYNWFFESPTAPSYTLTTYGQVASTMFQFMTEHDRGTPFQPVALVIDHLTGYNAYMNYPWGICEFETTGYRQIRDLFDYQIYPGSNFRNANPPYDPPPPPDNAEWGYLRTTPYGEMFNVHLSNVPAKILSAYPVILLAGDITVDTTFMSTLQTALLNGSTLLISDQTQDSFTSDQLTLLQSLGTVELLPYSTSTETGRQTVITNARLQGLANTQLPFIITGDPIQYGVNYTDDGYILMLINDDGVAKNKDTPAEYVVGSITATVSIQCMLPFTSATELFTGSVTMNPSTFTVEVGSDPYYVDAGPVQFIRFVN